MVHDAKEQQVLKMVRNRAFKEVEVALLDGSIRSIANEEILNPKHNGATRRFIDSSLVFLAVIAMGCGDDGSDGTPDASSSAGDARSVDGMPSLPDATPDASANQCPAPGLGTVVGDVDGYEVTPVLRAHYFPDPNYADRFVVVLDEAAQDCGVSPLGGDSDYFELRWYGLPPTVGTYDVEDGFAYTTMTVGNTEAGSTKGTIEVTVADDQCVSGTFEVTTGSSFNVVTGSFMAHVCP